MISIFTLFGKKKRKNDLIWVVRPSLVVDFKDTTFQPFEMGGVYEYIGIDPSPVEYRYILRDENGKLLSALYEWCFSKQKDAEKYIKLQNARYNNYILQFVVEHKAVVTNLEARIRFLEKEFADFKKLGIVFPQVDWSLDELKKRTIKSYIKTKK